MNMKSKGWEKKRERNAAPERGRYCPHCGSKMPVQATFCGNCGNPFPVEQEKKPLKRKKKAVTGIVIGGIIAAAVLTVTAVVVLTAPWKSSAAAETLQTGSMEETNAASEERLPAITAKPTPEEEASEQETSAQEQKASESTTTSGAAPVESPTPTSSAESMYGNDERVQLYCQWLDGHRPVAAYSFGVDVQKSCTNRTLLLADVTHDGLDELIVVEEFSEYDYLTVLKVEEDGTISWLPLGEGGSSHVNGFFGWYLTKVDDGYDLIRETFGMWQGNGTCGIDEFYLDANDEQVAVENYSVSSPENETVSQSDMSAYRENVSSMLHDAMLIGVDWSEGDGVHLDIDPSLYLPYRTPVVQEQEYESNEYRFYSGAIYESDGGIYANVVKLVQPQYMADEINALSVGDQMVYCGETITVESIEYSSTGENVFGDEILSISINSNILLSGSTGSQMYSAIAPSEVPIYYETGADTIEIAADAEVVVNAMQQWNEDGTKGAVVPGFDGEVITGAELQDYLENNMTSYGKDAAVYFENGKATVLYFFWQP